MDELELARKEINEADKEMAKLFERARSDHEYCRSAVGSFGTYGLQYLYLEEK